jgi:Tfp pilus assembly protein PilN
MEINRTVSYFTKTFKAELSDELYLTGGASRLKNLDKFFLFNLEGIQKIEPLNILKKVKGWAETGVLKQEMMMEQAMPHLSAAFAACLGAGGRINLMPVKERVQQKALLLSMALRIGLPLVLVVSVSFYLVDLANARKFARFSSALDRELAQLQETTSLVKEYQFMKTRLEERERTFEQTKQKQPYLFGLLKELSAVIPLHVTLNSLVLESAPGGKAVRLAGKIFAKYSVIDLEISQFQLTLEESPYFSQVSVVKREKDMYSAIPAENFEILCQLKY